MWIFLTLERLQLLLDGNPFYCDEHMQWIKIGKAQRWIELLSSPRCENYSPRSWGDIILPGNTTGKIYSLGTLFHYFMMLTSKPLLGIFVSDTFFSCDVLLKTCLQSCLSSYLGGSAGEVQGNLVRLNHLINKYVHYL